MHLLSINFASPAYDEGFRLRQQCFFEPYQAEISLEEIADEAADLHWGIYTDQAKLIGVVVQQDVVDPIILKQIVCDEVLEETQKIKLLEMVEQFFANKGMEALALYIPQKDAKVYQKLGYQKMGDTVELYGVAQQFIQKKL